ncbi:MAG: DUF4336 domain-containing protein [Deltaproteobacteria bacterium]|nr:DUF4336 domain-containing protein [Deltaproteobacteria bacterium]
MTLEQHDDDLWTKRADLSFLGLHVGTRMTVVRLPSGGLWVHSPIAVTPQLHDELRELGPVAHVVAPNLYHHLYAGPMVEAFEDARLHARPKLRTKCKQLRIDADLTEESTDQFEGVLDAVHIAGTMLDEVVFVHRPSRTLISADLIENFETSSHFFTRQYLRVGGIHGKPGVSRLLRPMIRKRGRTREAIDRLMTLDFDRIVVSHGDIMEGAGPDAVRDAYAWMR